MCAAHLVACGAESLTTCNFCLKVLTTNRANRAGGAKQRVLRTRQALDEQNARLPQAEQAFRAAQERLARLQSLIDAQYQSHSEAMVGSRQRVLVTGPATRDEGELQARTDNNRVVNFAGDATLINNYVDVAIIAAQPHSLRGELVTL